MKKVKYYKSMENTKFYEQIRNVSWLSTPAGTIWYNFFESNIQPVNTDLWDTPFGVDLDLLFDDPDEDLFIEIPEDEI